MCQASHSCLSLQPTSVKENPDLLENMDFNGSWQVYSQENYEEFLRAMGEKTKLCFAYKYILLSLVAEDKVAILMWLHPSNVCYNDTALQSKLISPYL